MSRVALILARAENGVIGARGKIPWSLPEDMRRFKALTLGKPCIMGRRTWDSLPTRPLPKRRNIVVTRDRNFRAEGAEIVHSPDDALSCAMLEQPAEIAVIGGADIYRAMLPVAQIVYLTEVRGQFSGDATMPPFGRTLWREVSREDHPLSAAGSVAFSFVTLKREPK